MKKIIFALILLALIPTTALAWDDCLNNEVDCVFPGECSRYVDTDNDQICDHSQPAPDDRDVEDKSVGVTESNLTEEEAKEIHELITGKELKTKTVDEIAEIYQINATEFSEKISEYLKTEVRLEDSFQFLHDNYGLEPNIAKDIATAMRVGTQADIPDVSDASNKQSGRTYHLLLISLILVVLYLVTFILSKKKIISVLNHKKIWNIALLISFLVSGILGILLIIRINFDIAISLPFNMLFWHVEVGIAMFVICIFHIIERWSCFKNLLKFKKPSQD